jgi:hypothetical protein
MATLPDMLAGLFAPQANGVAVEDDPFVALDQLGPQPDAPPLDAAPVPQPQATPVITLTAEQEQRLLQQLTAHYHEALQARDQLTQRREDRYRRFLADCSLRAGLQAWDDGPQLFTPLTRKCIEKLRDEFCDALGGVEKITAHGVGDEDVERGKKASQFYRYALTELNPLSYKRLQALTIFDALVDGVGLIKVYPWQSPFVPPETEQGQFLQRLVVAELVDQGTLLLPPNHTGWQWPQCAYIGQQLWPTLDEFPSMAERGFTLPEVEPLERRVPGARTYTDDERALVEFTRQGMEPDQAAGTYDPRVEMVESYELFAFELGMPRDFVVVHWFPHLGSPRNTTTASGQVGRVMLLADAMQQETFPRPMWPFCPHVVWEQANQARGMTVPERLQTAQDLVNRLTEQMVEQGEIDILPFVFANVALAGDLPNLRRIKPGEVVPLDNMGSVQFSPRNSNNRHYIEQMQLPTSWAEDDTGVTAYSIGRTPDQPNVSRTMGGMAMMLQQGQKGFTFQATLLAEQFQQTLKLYAGLWQGHVKPTLTFPVPNMEGLSQRLFDGAGDVAQFTQAQIGQEHWSQPFDVKIAVNPNAHLEQQKRMMLAEHLDTIIAPVWPIGRRELWKGIWESMGLQEFDRYYPEQVAVTQTQLLMLQAQLQLAQLEMALGMAAAPPPPPEGDGGAASSPAKKSVPAQGAAPEPPNPLEVIMQAMQGLTVGQPGTMGGRSG